jgi:hypothetical protein
LSIAYREGKKAFHRLQAEIIQHSHDRGLFIWEGSPSSYNIMFTKGPKAFSHKHSLPNTVEQDEGDSPLDPTYTLTNYGLHILLSIHKVVKWGGKYSLEGSPWQGQVDDNLKIGILGNIPGKKSLAVVLKPTA